MYEYFDVVTEEKRASVINNNSNNNNRDPESLNEINDMIEHFIEMEVQSIMNERSKVNQWSQRKSNRSKIAFY